MNFDFDFEHIESVEFGVGLDVPSDVDFVAIPVEINVKDTLKELLSNTKSALEKHSDNGEAESYSPSERYASVMTLKNDIADLNECRLVDLVTATNFWIQEGLPDLNGVSMYFARFVDAQGRKLIGIRKASQFKTLLNRQHRIINWINNALRMVEDTLLKLDNDFDLLLNANSIHILRPSSFEYLAVQDSYILEAVESNMTIIEPDISFMETINVTSYAKGHIRAARMIASIRSFKPVGPVDPKKLAKACDRCGFKLSSEGGKMIVPDKNIPDFLEILDRRRYEVTLVDGKTELFRATSRKKVRTV